MTQKSIWNGTPLYGILSYSGGQYSVVFVAVETSPECWSTSTLTGYGDILPVDRFPDIPIIDYRNNDGVFASLKIRDNELPAKQNPRLYGNTLDGYLAAVHACGVPILNWHPKTC